MIYVFAPNGRVLETHPVPADRPTKPGDVVATIFHSLGFDLESHLPGPGGRPFPLVDFGCHEISELF